MQIMINIDNVDYEYIKNGCIIPIKIDNHIYDAIRNGTPIPHEATNGDMAKAMFPKFIFEICGDVVTAEKYDPYCRLQFDLKWWNAPYEGYLNEFTCDKQ